MRNQSLVEIHITGLVQSGLSRIYKARVSTSLILVPEDLLFENYKLPVEVELSPLTRVKRQGPVDPKQYLDEEINHLIKTLPDSIDNAKERIQDSQFFKVHPLS